MAPRPNAGVPEEGVPLVEEPAAVNAAAQDSGPALSPCQSCYGLAMIRSQACLTLIATLALVACASDTVNYPSLAKREVERIANAPVPPPALPPVAADTDPALASRLESLLAQAEAAHGRFQSRRARAEALVAAASGAGVASESWSVATIAMADLESARSEAMVALADLDALWAAARVEGKPADAIASARSRVTGLVAVEDAVLAALRGRLAG